MTGAELLQHLQSGATTVCRAWILRRKDGVMLGFTDHDADLVVDGILCRAESGLTARALQQTTGLSVDNSEALGAFSDAGLREDDLVAGRFDGAEVRAYLVNWASPDEWAEQFRGSLGEIAYAGQSFRAELRGLSEVLNKEQGLVYQRGCSAVLGDARCGVDLNRPGYSVEVAVETVVDGRVFHVAGAAGLDDHWFEQGRLEVLSGASAGLAGMIRKDLMIGGTREVVLWQSLRSPILPQDRCRLVAGCDKSVATCRAKFGNVVNHRGFPHIPGDDLLASYPASDRPNGGGARLPRVQT